MNTTVGLNLLICMVGFGLLYWGAEWLVKGSSSLASDLGISPIVIGLTVVAFGTSAPELVVSLVSAINGKNMIAVGNVVGSNILNITLVLGMACVFQPITVQRTVITRDIPIMLGISIYLFIICLDSKLSRLDGITLFTFSILYTLFNYYISVNSYKNLPLEVTDTSSANTEKDVPKRYPRNILLIITGIAGVVYGAQLVVDSSVKIMSALDVSEKFIGLTIVAFGTSLPELATSVVAAIKKETDISVGNLIGSNVFNISSVLGLTSIIRPISLTGGFVKSGLIVDFSIMIMVSALPCIMMLKTHRLSRKNGGALLCCYTGFLIYLYFFKSIG